MKLVHLVIGGARSGKSRFAEDLIQDYEIVTRIYTAEAGDQEMRERIERHQKDRIGAIKGTVIEEATEILAAIKQHDQPKGVIMVDCLTLWLSNLMYYEKNITSYIENLMSYLQKTQGRIILISNETGCGIVPDNALARRFRDEQGLLNQKIGVVASHVSFIAAGFEIKLKNISKN